MKIILLFLLLAHDTPKPVEHALDKMIKRFAADARRKS